MTTRNTTTNYFECALCGKYKPVVKTQRIYHSYHFKHPGIHERTDREAKICSACYAWDYDVFRRGGGRDRHRKPLQLKDGRLLKVEEGDFA